MIVVVGGGDVVGVDVGVAVVVVVVIVVFVNNLLNGPSPAKPTPRLVDKFEDP